MIKEKISNFIKNKIKGSNKKTIENLIVFLILLIITIVAINLIWNNDNEEEYINPQEESYKVLAKDIETSNISDTKEYNLEDELEDILSKISGVGKVQVLITYSETSEIVAMKDESKNTNKTEETDSQRWHKEDRNNKSRYKNNSGFGKQAYNRKNCNAKNRRSNSYCRRRRKCNNKDKYYSGSSGSYRTCNS